MRKTGLALTLAVAAAIAVLPAKPARADGGATAAWIVGGVLIGVPVVSTVLTGHPWPYWYWGPAVTVKPAKAAKKAKKK
jgi:hypothetical protein